MLLESFYCPDGNSFPMTNRTLIEILFHFFPDFLWFEFDGFDLLPTITAKKPDISAFRIESVFSFLPKRWDIDEVIVGGSHAFSIKNYERLQDLFLPFPLFLSS